jgi:hypothetical protein
MKSTFVFCFCFFFFSFCHGQKNFKPGYVVLNSRDSLRGEIDYGNWDYNPKTVTFREKENTQVYKIADLPGFGVEGEDVYHRYIVSFHNSPAELATAKKNFGDALITDTVWLRLIYTGEKQLYELNTGDRPYFFIREKEDNPRELIFRVRLTDGVLYRDEQYKNLLTTYIPENDNGSLARMLEKLDYKQKDLVAFFEKINGGSGAKIKSTKNRSRTDLSAGLSLLHFNSPSRAWETSFKNTLGFRGGIGITVFSNRSYGRFQSRGGINIAYRNILSKENQGPLNNTTVKGNFLTLEPTIGFEYTFNPLQKVSFSIGPEVGYNIVLKKKMEAVSIDPVTSTRSVFSFAANSGFLVGGFNIAATGKFGKLILQVSLISEVLDVPTNTLTGSSISLLYRFYIN